MKDLLDYIELLEKESFKGWTKEAKKGYLTACTSIKMKALKINTGIDCLDIQMKNGIDIKNII